MTTLHRDVLNELQHHHLAANIEATIQEQNQARPSSKQVRIKHLLAVFSHWKTTQNGEEQMQPQDDNPSRGANLHPSHQACTQQQQRRQQQQVMTSSPTLVYPNIVPPTESSNIPLPGRAIGRMMAAATRTPDLLPIYRPNCSGAFNTSPVGALNNVVAEKRLWQALVVPLCLGCVIFLVAIWSKQINVALKDDTIMMIIILGTVFLSMSAMAFWLAKNAQLDNEDRSAQSHSHLPARLQEIDTHRRYHQHLQAHQYHHTHRTQHQHHPNCPRHAARLQQAEEEAKSYRLAVIDCEPPDYLSAISNSVPVNFSATSQVDMSSRQNCRLQPNAPLSVNCTTQMQLTSTDNPALSDWDQQQQLNLPPSYDDSTRFISPIKGQ